jgi:sugar lactone lactonase YvrE
MEEIYGMTSCAVNSCIYISNFKHFTVHKIELANNNEMVNWSVAAEPTGLHVNGIQNLLVTCRGAMKLQEYTTGGQLVREINLNPDLPSPWLAVELTNGRYAISCGNRVCLVDASGQVVFNYGGTTGGSAIGQLNFPVGLAKVKNGCILVACRHSNRIVILNSTLSSARDLQLPAEAQLQRPWVLYLDESVDRMYVGEYEGGRVLVFDDLVNLGV